MKKILRNSSLVIFIAIVGLIGRAALDKLLAIKGGTSSVADWAQILSLTELFIGPIGAGIGIGLTALVSRHESPIHRADILSEGWRAFKYSVLTSFCLVIFIGLLHSWQRAHQFSVWPMITLAIIAGLSGAYLNLINAWWAGKEDRIRILVYTICSSSIICGVAYISDNDNMLISLISTQALIATVLLILSINGKLPNLGKSPRPELRHEINQYLIAGMVIGFMSPLSLLLIRYQLDLYGSLGTAGTIQSVWRISEWIATPAATLISIYFLPKFSKASLDYQACAAEIRQALILILPSSGALYVLCYLNYQSLTQFFYSVEFQADQGLVWMFMLSDWLRIFSWILLFCLYALKSIRWIIIGEFFSLPLFCGLIYLSNNQLTPQTIALCYLSSYLAYFFVNICGVKHSLNALKNHKPQ